MHKVEAVKLPEEILEFIRVNQPRYPNKRAVLIPALMECQKWYGYVSNGMAAAVSEATGVALSEVESVISFYTMLISQPTGRYFIGICGTWNCEHAGAKELATHFKKKYGIGLKQTTEDGLFTCSLVECLCDCHNAPSVQFLKWGRDFKATWANNLTTEIFDSILEDLAAGNPDALRERLVRIDKKENAPDDKNWFWIVTTNAQYPAWIEGSGDSMVVHDGYGKLGDLKINNPELHREISIQISARS